MSGCRAVDAIIPPRADLKRARQSFEAVGSAAEKADGNEAGTALPLAEKTQQQSPTQAFLKPCHTTEFKEQYGHFGSTFPVTGASLPRLLYPRIAVEVVALPNLSALCQGWMFGARFALSR
jgi:hypothetical protein